MLIRCPHCHHRIDEDGETERADRTCPDCGSRFNVAGDAMTATRVPETRQSFGRFHLLEQLGLGKFGSVWKARDPLLERTVAVKVPRKEELDESEMELFAREGRAAAQLRHPNIVSVHEVGREKGTVYLVSDYVPGANLQEWLAGQRLTPREAAELCATIAEALHHAHEAGIVHRDLKPANIMVDPDGLPHVMDFGLAKRSNVDVTMTVEGQILGTPAYMSPELARGQGRRADARSDVYSLGVILYELLTSEKPFRGEMRMLVVQILREEPTPPRRLNSHIRRDLETICLKCLEKDPARRYQTAGALAEDLRRYLHGEAIVARPVGRLEKTWRWSRRNPSAAGLVASIFLLLVLAFSGTLWYVQDRAARAAEAARREAKIARQSAQLEQEIAVALNEASTLIERGWELVDLPHQWEATLSTAQSAVRRAQALAARADPLDPTLQQHLEQLERQLAAAEKNRRFAARFDAIRMQMTEVDVTTNSFDFDSASPNLVQALADFGLPPGKMAPEKAVAYIRRQPAAMQPILDAALGLCLFQAPETATAQREWLQEVLAASDLDPWRSAVRKAVLRDDVATLKRLAREVEVASQPVSFLVHLAEDLRGLGALENALALLHRVHRAAPGDVFVNHRLGWMLIQEGKYEHALRYFTAVLALRPRNAVALLNYGAALSNGGNPAAAVAVYRKALEFQPNYPELHENLSIALRVSGDLAASLDAARNAIELDPDHVDAYLCLGLTQKVLGHWQSAVATFRQAVELRPDSLAANYWLGRALNKVDQHQAAVTALRKVLELQPDHAAAHHQLGHSFWQLGKLDESIEAFHNAIELQPKYAKHYSCLSKALREREGPGDLRAALAACQKAIELAPNFASGRFNLGNSYWELDNLPRAIAAYRKAIELEPDYEIAYYNLGSALTHQDRYREALVALKRAKELYSREPGSESDLADIGQRIRQCKKRLARHTAKPSNPVQAPRPASEKAALVEK